MTNNFKILGISKELEKVLEKDGITKPTPIQEQAIPQLLKGKDVIAQAHTGTGKTFAFMLPIMETIDITKPCIQALIIAPTRELAIQITNEAKKLAQAKNISILAVYGGQDVERQLRKLNKGVNIVIGTPGRLLDHMGRKSIDLGQVKMIVLDEADEMLNMGFLKDVEEIIYKTSKTRQTMLFSATMPKQLRSLAVRYMKEPVQIQIQSEKVTLDEIKQVVIETTDRGKQDALCSVIDEERPFMAMIFCRTKRRVKALNSDLRNRGYNSDEIHGDLSQAKREKVINSFRDMKLQLLVATDVAARGLDIEGITHIFNYDIPEDAESYIHRIGRTGRAGETGKAFTFVTPRDQQDLISIENKIRMNLKKRKIVKDNVKGKTNRNNSNEQINKKQDFRWNKDSGKKKTIRSIEKRKGKKK
ncbi:DEAD/DEAH box helicase [Tissierella carlieri]|uniref:DEAD/DEAH box helicase n=1 Tax=Tissierella carlieri TaxID=689904 RepID=UPI001C123C98|nr:DEAD/DEAH box helicase [Tissierella carlieri]MBU5310916.1 DEAD/DEAH box helicase [Tissierella carlieri]